VLLNDGKGTFAVEVDLATSNQRDDTLSVLLNGCQ